MSISNDNSYFHYGNNNTLVNESITPTNSPPYVGQDRWMKPAADEYAALRRGIFGTSDLNGAIIIATHVLISDPESLIDQLNVLWDTGAWHYGQDDPTENYGGYSLTIGGTDLGSDFQFWVTPPGANGTPLRQAWFSIGGWWKDPYAMGHPDYLKTSGRFHVGTIITRLNGKTWVEFWLDGSRRQSKGLPTTPILCDPKAGITFWASCCDPARDTITHNLNEGTNNDFETSTMFVTRLKGDHRDKYDTIMRELSENRDTFPPTAIKIIVESNI